MVNTTNKVIATVQRKGDIVATKPQRHTALRKAAETLSRRNADAAVCELMNEALGTAVRLLYEKDDDGWPSNVDTATARILIPVPWGRAGHARWGLRQQEANVLRAILFARMAQGGLFQYDRNRRSWYLNVADYPSLRAAVDYLARCPVNVGEYRAARIKLVEGA